jgi:hypothetical protein
LNRKIKVKEFEGERKSARIERAASGIKRENFRGKYYFVARVNGRIDAMRRQARDFRKADAVSFYKQHRTFYEDRIKESWKNEHGEYVNEIRSSGKDLRKRAYKGHKFGITLSAEIDGQKVSASSNYKKQSLHNAREQAKVNLLKVIRGRFNVDTDTSEKMLFEAEENKRVRESAVWFVKSS